jgi:membrane protein implicated in regulation of membrane protease activity
MFVAALQSGEVFRPMWIIFSIFLVLLLLGIEFYVPPVFLLLFFVGVIVSVAFALTPARSRRAQQ